MAAYAVAFMSPITQRALTDDDAFSYVALVDAVCDADDNDERWDEEEYLFHLHDPLNVPGIDATQGFFEGDRLVAAGLLRRRSEATPVHWMMSDGAVHPDYRGHGVGTRLLHWMEEAAPRIHERCFPGQPLELAVGALDANVGAKELFENEGYGPLRWFFSMKRPEGVPMPEPAVSDGLEFETYTDAVCEELRVVHNEVFRDHWRATPQTRESWESYIGQDGIQRELTFMLRDRANGKITGYLVSFFSGADFEATGVRDIQFGLIGTRRDYRKRGVASSLLTHAVTESRKSGYQTASLGVDAENPSGALGLYQANGFECERKYVAYSKMLQDNRDS